MAITDADRDAVVAALEEWTTTTGEAYVRARAFACQTDCTPTTVEQILAALAGKNLRGVDLEPPTHLEVAVWRENAQYTTYRVVDTSTDTESDTASDQEATDDDTDADEELVVTAGTSCRRVPAVATTSRTCGTARPARASPVVNPSPTLHPASPRRLRHSRRRRGRMRHHGGASPPRVGTRVRSSVARQSDRSPPAAV
jgi:hypothetical protein